MRKLLIKLFDIFFYLAITVFLVGLLIFPKPVSAVVIDTLAVCGNVILPSLFPFFVLSSMIITSGFAAKIGPVFSGFMKHVFGLPGCSGIAFFLGILSGYPVGANTAISLYQSGQCTKNEAERLLAFCNNTGPAFILGTVGAGIWKDVRVGILLYTCQTIASVITGVIFRFYHSKQKSGAPFHQKRKPPLRSRSDIFVTAVKSSAENVFYICAFIMFFAVVIELLTQLKFIPFISHVFASLLSFTPYGNEISSNLVKGFFEVTTGVRLAGKGAAVIPIRLAVTGAILSWAGLSVHCQVLSFLSGSGLSATPYILGKFAQSLIGAAITYAAAIFYPIRIPVIGSGSMPIRNLSGMDLKSTLLSSLSIFCACLIFLGLSLVITFLKSTGKRNKRHV
ncbi:MAG: sporulation protein [Bacillota bacterium]|nr:sporulation protein [Bacillota bacterium]